MNIAHFLLRMMTLIIVESEINSSNYDIIIRYR